MAYWGIIAVVAFLAVYYFTNRAYAKKIALELMLYIEKKAEEYAISEGTQKKDWVISQYDNLPAVVKSVITKDMFTVLVQNMFDEALKLVKKQEQ